jgi:phage terminase large subunit
MITKRPKMITFNPNGHDWIWRRFDQHIDLDGKELGNIEDYELVMATTLENKQNLPEDYLKAILANPEEWQLRFVQGSFDTKAGRIFDEFNRQVHVVAPFQIPREWLRIRAIDHGQTNPTACLWGAIDFDNNIWVYREYYKPKLTVSEHVRNILDRSMMMGPHGPEPEKYGYTVIDPSTHMKNREKDGYRYSVADEYSDAGIPTINGQNAVEAGIMRVRQYLAIDPERWHPTLLNHLGEPMQGSPKVFIFSDCEWLIKELPEYQWKPLSYKQIGMANNPEQPVKSFDHAVDAFRYLIMSRPVAPEHLSQIDPGIWQDPIQLQMHARRNGLTVEDLVAQRFRTEGHIRHREGGIPVREGL